MIRDQPAATRASSNSSAGIGVCSRHVIAIGRLCWCCTYVAGPSATYGMVVPYGDARCSRTNSSTCEPSLWWLM